MKMKGTIIFPVCLLIFSAALGQFTLGAVPQPDLVKVSSVYLADDGVTRVKVQGTGTPVSYKVGKVKKCAILTSSHVTGGQFEVSPQPLRRCTDLISDVDLIDVSCKGFVPMADYDSKHKRFKLKKEALKQWRMWSIDSAKTKSAFLGQDETLMILGYAKFPDPEFKQEAKTENKKRETIRASITQLYETPEQVLVPSWVEYKPRSAHNKKSGDFPIFFEKFVQELAFGGEMSSSAAISPGMSGSPLVSSPEDKNWGKDEVYIEGISSRVLRHFDRSYFASYKAIARLMDAVKEGKCNALSNGSWKYKIFPSKEGFTYRSLKTKKGDILEIDPVFVRAGSALGMEVGGGGSNDGGDSSADRVVGYQLDEVGRLVDSPDESSWARLKTRPGITLNGKSVSAFKITAKGYKPVLVSADIHAVDLLERFGDDAKVEALSAPVDFVQIVKSNLVRKKGDLPCLELTSNRTIYDGSAKNDHSVTSSVRIQNDSIRVFMRFEGDELEFELNKDGVLKGSKNPYYVPVIVVRGKKTNAPFVVDICGLFFVDLSQADILGRASAYWDKTKMNDFDFRWREVVGRSSAIPSVRWRNESGDETFISFSDTEPQITSCTPKDTDCPSCEPKKTPDLLNN